MSFLRFDQIHKSYGESAARRGVSFEVHEGEVLGLLGPTEKQAQQWGMVWALLAVVPMMFLGLLLHEPHGTAGRVLSWLPFSSPIVLVVRLALDPAGVAWWELAGGITVLVGATWLAIRVGARLFRVGILLTGARPKLREILRQARLS
ncbi:MAG TPA: ABC transporter permease [Candidatus Polarisedimenticolia bacterium]|jgi:ABC-2 type transport system permease protein